MPNMSPIRLKCLRQDPNVRNKTLKKFLLGYTKEQAMEEATQLLKL